MKKGCFIITGTSRGIGEQLAAELLEQGHLVAGLSRSDSARLAKYKHYTHYPCDLSNTHELESILDDIIKNPILSQLSMICLINNAAMLEPLRTIERCETEEISNHLQVTLLAPMVLTSRFIKLTENIRIRKKIVNVTSGSGFYPAPGMSVYCTAKAGINMFTQAVAAEQVNQPEPIEIIAVDPGMVETDLQKLARGKDLQEFEMAKLFQKAYDEGGLLSTKEMAKHFIHIIEQKHDNGKVVHYSEGQHLDE